MPGDWQIQALVACLVAGACAVLGASMRGAAEVDVGRAVGVLRYGATMRRTIGLIVAAAGALLLTITFFDWPLGSHGALQLAILVPMVPGAVALWEMRTRVEIDEAGIVQHSPWRGRVAIAWSEIREVRFGAGGWFLLRGTGGRFVRVNGMLDGIETLIAALRRVLRREMCSKAIGAYHEARRRSPFGG